MTVFRCLGQPLPFGDQPQPAPHTHPTVAEAANGCLFKPCNFEHGLMLFDSSASYVGCVKVVVRECQRPGPPARCVFPCVAWHCRCRRRRSQRRALVYRRGAGEQPSGGRAAAGCREGRGPHAGRSLFLMCTGPPFAWSPLCGNDFNDLGPPCCASVPAWLWPC